MRETVRCIIVRKALPRKGCHTMAGDGCENKDDEWRDALAEVVNELLSS